MGDGGPSAADIKAQMQAAGKPDPGLQYLREVHLTSEEQAELSAKARGDIPGLIAMECGTKEDGWKSSATLWGVRVFSKPSEGPTQRVICKGQTQLPPEVTMDMVKTQFIKAYNNSRMLAQQMRSSDPMSRETRIVAQLPCGDDEFIRIVWGSFAATGVAWARDFCFLQHAAPLTDPKTQENLFAIVAGSVERPEVPDMQQTCKRIRSTVETSGYVFREAADGSIRATYVVNVNPNGWLPTKIVNTIAVNQSLNTSRVRKRLAETAQALSAMEVEPPLFSSDIGWRSSYAHPIARPSAGSAPLPVRVKFWANGKVFFRIRGAGEGVASEWKPAEAEKQFARGGWESYSKNTAASVEFLLQPCKGNGGSGGSDSGVAAASDAGLDKAGESCVIEWKAGGWFSGLSVYHAITPAPDYSARAAVSS